MSYKPKRPMLWGRMEIPKIEPEGFEEWWDYWRANSAKRPSDTRGLARAAYNEQIANGASPADIMDGAHGLFRALSKEDRRFLKDAHRWLGEEAYVDCCKDERAFQAQLAERAQRPQNVVALNPGSTSARLLQR